MKHTPRSLDPKTLAKIKGLRLRARHIVEGYVAGLHRSPFRGFSIEFAEHREYAPGDDLRYLDWKVFGRTDKLYLKQFEDETNLICYLVLDASESMRYCGPESVWSKFEYAQTLAAALAWLVLQQQDAVGLITFDTGIRASVRPSSNPSHLQQILDVLEATVPQNRTSAAPIFHELAERMSKRGVIIILSDLFDNVDAWMTGLKHFRHRRHDVVLFQVLDPAEVTFPFSRPARFCGLEQWPDVVTDPRALRKAYLREFEKFLQTVRLGCRQNGIDYHTMLTNVSLEQALTTYLSTRAQKMT